VRISTLLIDLKPQKEIREQFAQNRIRNSFFVWFQKSLCFIVQLPSMNNNLSVIESFWINVAPSRGNRRTYFDQRLSVTFGHVCYAFLRPFGSIASDRPEVWGASMRPLQKHILSHKYTVIFKMKFKFHP
jgi:hypothetical protein